MTDVKIQRETVIIPGSSSTAANDIATHIGRLTAAGIPAANWWNWRYIDSSPLGMWAYHAHASILSNGIMTVVEVICSGMAHPPSGSNLTPMPDPGPGTLTWAVMGAPFEITTSRDTTNDVKQAPPNQNNYFWTWPVAANSPTVVADFTAAVAKMIAGLSGSSFINYYKYVDSVSGAWAVYAQILYIGAGFQTPIGGLVHCSGTPHPPTGSPLPAVALPAFTQTFTSIGAPLALRPGR